MKMLADVFAIQFRLCGRLCRETEGRDVWRAIIKSISQHVIEWYTYSASRTFLSGETQYIVFHQYGPIWIKLIRSVGLEWHSLSVSEPWVNSHVNQVENLVYRPNTTNLCARPSAKSLARCSLMTYSWDASKRQDQSLLVIRWHSPRNKAKGKRCLVDSLSD